MNVLDLFCGCGGFSRGIEMAGGKIIAGIDFCEPAIQTHHYNFPYSHSLKRDLTTYSPEQCKEELQIAPDIIVGGPPCQGFSMAGRRNENDPRNSLFIEFVKYIEFFKPKAFIMENVLGILTMKTSENTFVKDIILEELGRKFHVSHMILYAPEFGVPQKRKRVFFTGLLKEKYERPISVLRGKFKKEEFIPVGQILLPREKIEKKYFLSERAIEGIRKRKEKMKNEGKGFGAQFLKLDEPSYTISARYYKDGYDALVKYSDTEIRKLTIEELKSIQTLDLEMKGTPKEQIIQIGNAVPSLLGKAIFQHVVSFL